MVPVPEDRVLLLQLERAYETLEDKWKEAFEGDGLFAELRDELFDTISTGLDDDIEDLDKRVTELEKRLDAMARVISLAVEIIQSRQEP
jgi:hypothetical protein